MSFRSVLQAVDVLRGPAFIKSCREHLSPELDQILQYESFLASTWYPIDWYRELLEAVRIKGGGSEQFLHQVGRQCMQQDAKGVYRAVYNLLSPQTVVRLCPRLFNNYYDVGKCTIIEAKSGFAHARWFGCEGFSRDMWCEVFGATEMLMELAGAKDLRTRIIAGGRDGDDSADFAARWSSKDAE